MSTSNYREPTNDELWAQPPVDVNRDHGPQGLAPLPQPPVPAVVHHNPTLVPQQRPDRTPFVLAIVSVALGIPLTAIASSNAGFFGLLIAWIGIVAVNVVYSWSRRGK